MNFSITWIALAAPRFNNRTEAAWPWPTRRDPRLHSRTSGRRVPRKKSYQAVFWYQLACAATALVVLLCFVRIKKAKSQETVDEREAREYEEQRVAQEEKE